MRFSSTVDVLENQGTTPGPFGKPSPRWVTIRTGVKCQVQRGDGTERRSDAGSVEVVDFIIFAPINPPWTGAHRLLHKGQLLQIIDVDRNVVDRGHHSETLARKVGSGG